MIVDEKNKERLAMAERLLELAEHSSEAEMRSSLSRIYYAVYHVAIVLVGTKRHKDMPAALDRKENGLGERYRRLLELRRGADYDPYFVSRFFGGLDNFKVQFSDEMEAARSLYEHLLEMDEV